MGLHTSEKKCFWKEVVHSNSPRWVWLKCWKFPSYKLPTLGVDVAGAPSDPWWLFRCFFYHGWFIIPPVLSSEIWHISWKVLPIFFEEDFCSDDSNSDYKSGGCVFLYKAMVTVTFSCFFSTGRLFLFFEFQENPSKISRDSSMEGWIRRWRCVGNPRRTPGVTTVDWRKVHSVDGSEIRLTTWDVLSPW